LSENLLLICLPGAHVIEQTKNFEVITATPERLAVSPGRGYCAWSRKAMQPPPPEHWLPSEGRDWRGREKMEETMRVLTLNELMRLSKIELCDLAAKIKNALPDFPERSPEAETPA
jgi:hypothetical protein